MLELRASKIGGCVRGYIMDLRADAEPELPDKTKLYFAVGKTLEPVIIEHAGYDPKLLLNDQVEVRVKIEPGLVITGHPDACIDGWIIECKTMRTFSFQKLMSTSMFIQFPQYLVQGAVYCKGMDAKGVIYLCLDKDASEIHRVRVEEWELKPYWDIAVENARKIRHWRYKKNLPGRAKDLPSWCCIQTYCLRHNCRYNYINRRKYERTR